jgi:uncharacterized SAM-binding protein YcdF (DUF218 family)
MGIQYKAAIVLGGGLEVTEVSGQHVYRPKKQARDRLDKACALFTTQEVDYIITTGRYSKRVGIDSTVIGSKNEAEVGKLYIEEKMPEIDKTRVLYENQSFDTIGNAWFSKIICLEPFNITVCKVITSDYHQERSEIIFKWVLGPKYTVECISVPSQIDKQQLIEEKRKLEKKKVQFEKEIQQLTKILALDDPKIAIREYIKEERQLLEREFISYIQTCLLGAIAPGDNESIGKFMKNEHLRYCLSEQSEEMFNLYMKIAKIDANY